MLNKLKCDDSTHFINIRHMMSGDKDICLEYFGEEDEECKQTNNVK